MFRSQFLEIVAGLIIVYLVARIIASTIREMIEGGELGWFQTIPRRAGNRTNALTDKDYVWHYYT
jgi:hypothetical protein